MEQIEPCRFCGKSPDMDSVGDVMCLNVKEKCPLAMVVTLATEHIEVAIWNLVMRAIARPAEPASPPSPVLPPSPRGEDK